MDLRRLKEQAARLNADGRYEKAEVLYRQLLTHAPRDSGLWLKHAEVCKRLDRVAPALASFRLAAQLLGEEGHHQRAIACLKNALGLRPDDVDLVTDIIRAELHQRAREKDRVASTPYRSDQSEAEELDVAPRLLALPMFSSTESRLEAVASEALPSPSASVPRIPIEVDAPIVRWPQVRRLPDGTIAIKPSPFSHWIVLTSGAPIGVRFFEEFPVPDEAHWLEEPS